MDLGLFYQFTIFYANIFRLFSHKLCHWRRHDVNKKFNKSFILLFLLRSFFWIFMGSLGYWVKMCINLVQLLSCISRNSACYYIFWLSAYLQSLTFLWHRPGCDCKWICFLIKEICKVKHKIRFFQSLPKLLWMRKDSH